jgi:hypothetical protein
MNPLDIRSPVVTLFLLIDPLGNIPLFSRRCQLAWKATV